METPGCVGVFPFFLEFLSQSFSFVYDRAYFFFMETEALRLKGKERNS